MHEKICATQKSGKNYEKTELYGADMRREANIWWTAGERPVLGKDNKFMWSLILALFRRYRFT